MPRVSPQKPLHESVFDRLLDDKPDTPQDPPRRQHHLLSDLKASVLRDLQALLSTRARLSPCPPSLKELGETLLSYGVPDFSASTLSGADAARDLPAVLQEIILRHEPRLTEVTVHAPQSPQPSDRSLHFPIDARLRAEPAPEPLAFDSVLDAASGTFEVREEGG